MLGSMRAPDDSEVRAGLVGSARSRACLSVCLLPRCVCVCFRTRSLFLPPLSIVALHVCVASSRASLCRKLCAPETHAWGTVGTPTWGQTGYSHVGFLGTQTWVNLGAHAQGSEGQCRLVAARLRRTVLQRHSTRTHAHAPARALTRTRARAHTHTTRGHTHATAYQVRRSDPTPSPPAATDNSLLG